MTKRIVASLVGPIGELGVLARDGETVQCHACGRWFKDLEGSHLFRVHGMEAEDYRVEYGLNRSTPLMSSARSAQRGRWLAPYRRPDLIYPGYHASKPRRLEGIRHHRAGWRNGSTGPRPASATT